MRLKKVEKKGLKLPIKDSLLTLTEKEILHLLTEEFLTIKQIAFRREVSLQAVYKTIKKLKKKGVYGIGINRVEKVESTHSKRDVRLHGQELNIKILYQDNRFQKLLKKSNMIFIDGNTIRLYKNSIEVYCGHSFYANKAQGAEKKSLEYLKRFLLRLEHELKVGLLKPRSRNIKIVNQHFARGDSEICDNAIEKKKRVWIYAEEDGKLAFITDNSFGFREDETVHPLTGKQDRKAVDRQVNDWRLNNPPTNSELNNNLKRASEILIKNQELIAGLPKVLNKLEAQIESHLSLIKEYRKENKTWRMKKTREITQEIKSQPSLKEWL